MREKEALEIFERANGIVRGHFVYTKKEPTEECPSGWFHGEVYVNKDAIFRFPLEHRKLAHGMAKLFLIHRNVGVVVGPEKGGITLASRIAEELTEMEHHARFVEAAFIEKDGAGGWILERGFEDAVRGRRVALCENVINSGSSIKAVREAIEAIGGNVVAIVAMWNRGGVTGRDLGVEPHAFKSLVNGKFDTYPEEICPLCENGIPVNTNLGKGKEFLEDPKRGRTQNPSKTFSSLF